MLKQFRDTKYYCNELGEIFSLNNGEKIKLKEDTRKGYKAVTLYHDGWKMKISSHRFIYECFNGRIPEKMTVDHIDFNILNNNINNLQLLTRTDNSRKKASVDFIGYNNPRSKITDNDLVLLFKMKGSKRSDIRKATGISKSTQIRIEKGISYYRETRRLGLIQGSY